MYVRYIDNDSHSNQLRLDYTCMHEHRYSIVIIIIIELGNGIDICDVWLTFDLRVILECSKTNIILFMGCIII